MVVRCPRCNIDMQSIHYSGITVDKCPECSGVWLDQGEERFVQEVLKMHNKAACRDCNHFKDSDKSCNLHKMFVSRDFSCSNFIR